MTKVEWREWVGRILKSPAQMLLRPSPLPKRDGKAEDARISKQESA